MKIIGVIPARYQSSRFEGKPLADIQGKPMIWWVHHQFKKAKGIDEVFVATDDERVKNVCEHYNINVIMTSDKHKTHIDRLHEVSTKVDADFYINVNGDEPLIEPHAIERIIPVNEDPSQIIVYNGMTEVTNPVDIADTSKIKIAVDVNGYGMYMARYPIPFPKGSAEFTFKKFVGVQSFTKSALQFSVNTTRGAIESIEDIDEYRFLENGQKIKFINVDVITVSVDTPKDLIKVNEIIRSRGQANE